MSRPTTTTLQNQISVENRTMNSDIAAQTETWNRPRQDLALPEQGLVVLAGPARAGKTVTALQIAVSVAAGHELFGCQIQRPGPVVFVSREVGPEQIRHWLTGMKRALDITAADIHFVFAGGAEDEPFVTGDRWAEVWDLVSEINPRLIVVDPIVVPGDAETPAQLEAELRELHQLAFMFECLVLATFELPMDLNAAIEGAGVLADLPDLAKGVLLTDRHLGDRVRIISHFRGQSFTEPAVLWLSRDPETFVAQPVGDETVTTQPRDLAFLVGGAAIERVNAAFAPHYVNRVLRQLREFAASDKGELDISVSRRVALLAETDSMGLTPIADAQGLALLASALGLTQERELVRLLWVVNRDQHQRYEGAAERWSGLAGEAIALLPKAE